MPVITPIYAALVTFMFLVLCARVIVFRRDMRVAFGSGGHDALEARIRAQGNCAEYAPMGLILLLMLELLGAPVLLLHVLGAMLVIGRALHALGLSAAPQNFTLRSYGMALTLFMLAGAGAGCFVLAVAA